MKLCPNCKTTYSDDTLRFCLADGTSLIPTSAAEKTVEMSGGTNQMRLDIPMQSVPTMVSPVKTQTEAARSGINPWFIFLPLLALLFLAVIGLLGYILLKPETVVVTNTATPTPTATATPDKETAALKEELESLKKQIEEQKTPSKSDSTARPFPTPDPPAPVTQIARVNSPNDGFLALRNTPDAEIGDRLAKIPHGTNIEIIGCQKKSTRIGTRSGRWCRANYSGQSGWVFDAFLAY
jgi:hypothetical protein